MSSDRTTPPARPIAHTSAPLTRRGVLRGALAGLALGVGWSLGARAALAQGDASREAALILRILSYDRNLSRRASGTVLILVAFLPGNAASESERTRIMSALNALGARTTVASMPARAAEHPYRDAAGLLAAMRAQRAAAVYVCSGLAGQVSAISGVAREASSLTMTADGDAVRRGLGVGLVADGSQVRLMVNLPAVEAEGARLDAAVLRLAEVIR